MGCQHSKVSVTYQSIDQYLKYDGDDNDYNKNDSIFSLKTIADDDAIICNLTSGDDHIPILVADPQAFNTSFVKQRQQAIDNRSYQLTIESSQPESLQQLTDIIKAFSFGKSIVDIHWIIFYWIVGNIQYDIVPFIHGKCSDQSPEKVFQKRKAISVGYANLYKYLCDQLQMLCQIISGYAKGHEFENHIDIPTKSDHKWNAVEIDQHWYLIESTWGAGYVNEQNIFQHEPNSYYFLSRPNEMICHHLPNDDQWQLLQTPIKMAQYLEIPHFHPLYFDLNIEIVSPCNRSHLHLIPGRSYALVLLKVPSDVHLTTDLKLNNQVIDGGSYIMLDKRQQITRSYFAPRNIGRHKIYLYGKRGNSFTDDYRSVFSLVLDVKQILKNPISFPKVWKNFFDFDLEVISPRNTYLIKLDNGDRYSEILIKTPENIELRGHLQNERQQKVTGGEQVYYDRRKVIWRCKFAPDRNGLFEALIMTKKKTDPEIYTSAVAFQIEAQRIPLPSISYPSTWQLFHDLDLRIESPRNRSSAYWSDNATYTEIFIQAPDDIQLSCDIKYDNVKIENGSLAQFNHEKKLWQLLFAPERIGEHELIVYSKKNNDNKSSLNPVVKFNLNVKKLQRSMKFPITYHKFQTEKCQIYTPIDGILMKESIVPIHCVIPGAKSINMTVDSQLLNNEGYKNPILQRHIKVGSKDVFIYAKYGQSSSFDALMKYTVQ
ncbi:unnamed protein product [Rotaria sp. Silwood2]|nr:unnamed protein product [Rotaria sp. Silwood2]CAF3147837.1 unnamed protein product [Rotaria sp. Silwood2]CAF4338780.1 unnamed protein product [Rotaria sp. Silwood2]CAF4587411.1 unnamed protein product [Rotaria sp. Silwood2]